MVSISNDLPLNDILTKLASRIAAIENFISCQFGNEALGFANDDNNFDCFKEHILPSESEDKRTNSFAEIPNSKTHRYAQGNKKRISKSRHSPTALKRRRSCKRISYKEDDSNSEQETETKENDFNTLLVPKMEVEDPSYYPQDEEENNYFDEDNGNGVPNSEHESGVGGNKNEPNAYKEKTVSDTIKGGSGISNGPSIDCSELLNLIVPRRVNANSRPRKTTRGVPFDKMKEAANEVLSGCSVHSVSKRKNIPCASLRRFMHKLKTQSLSKLPALGYWGHNRVYSDEQEDELEQYLKEAAELYCGLSYKEIRKLAFQCAEKRELKYPAAWEQNGMAGESWLRWIMKRHPELPLLRPQETSLSKAARFNNTNVTAFFENLKKWLTLHSFLPQAIYNMDVTGITTVHQPDRIIARKGSKQLGYLTSAEAGTLVSIAVTVNAVGNCIPPHFVFPHTKFEDCFIREGPPGCIGTANSSGCMQEDDLFVFMQHFKNHSGASIENKVLLLLDNLDSYVSVKIIDFCKSNGIFLLTFPPHCSHKLRPLHRSVFGPLQHFVNSACDAWIKSKPGGTKMTIFDVPRIVHASLSSAATTENIIDGFKHAGIFPFNPDIFEQTDLCSF